MSVKIRLTRRGRKKQPIYDVVVADARAPRDGKFIEKIGRYNPNTNPAFIELDEQKAFDWVMKGAQPTETVRAMLSYIGVMFKKHLQIGVNKGAITQEAADKRFAEWQAEKLAKIESKKDNLTKDSEGKAKARREAEVKVKEARAESLRKKAEAVIASTEEAAAEETTEEVEAAPVAETPVETAPEEVEEAPVAETPVETAPEVVEEAPVAEAPVETTPEAPAKEEEKTKE
jgi:small subunit ribosomal protein S16